MYTVAKRASTVADDQLNTTHGDNVAVVVLFILLRINLIASSNENTYLI
jgi:hypothetical protein